MQFYFLKRLTNAKLYAIIQMKAAIHAAKVKFHIQEDYYENIR